MAWMESRYIFSIFGKCRMPYSLNLQNTNNNRNKNLITIYSLREERVDERGQSTEPKARDLRSHNGMYCITVVCTRACISKHWFSLIFFFFLKKN